MAYQHNWSITKLVRNTGEDGVIYVGWKLETTDDADPSYKRVMDSMMNVIPNPNNPNYVLFANLTEAKCLDWVWETINKAALEAKHEAPVVPAVETDLPW